MMRDSLSRQSMELLKELTDILREIISSGDEKSLERLQQMVRAIAETRLKPRDSFH